ncbi:MAG TPA: class I lanthipeptide [Thermoanaerobaculia bacterium]|nr:class I lanthipeptide [Thermoanaerobaculia bacterium]
MKKKTKKLVLAKETVRSLEDPASLRNIAGGRTIFDSTCPDGCTSGVNTCGTCACGPTQTGTSRYC